MKLEFLLPSDQHALRAAEGWYELGLPREALVEIGRLSEPLKSHASTLLIRYECLAAIGSWEEAFIVGCEWVTFHPEEPAAWIRRAYASRRRPEGGVQEAFALLEPAGERFPVETLIPYNLACYQAQLGDLPAARLWLEKAFLRDENKQLRRMALTDPDLRPLWPELLAENPCSL